MIYLLEGADSFCTSTANIWQVVGYIFMVLKIVIPIILIVLGAIKLGSAVVADKSDEISKAAVDLGKKMIGAIIIFFIPTIVGWVFSIVNGGKDTQASEGCIKCITSPNGTTCKKAATTAWGSDNEIIEEETNLNDNETDNV